MVKAVILAGSLAALSSALPTQNQVKRAAEPQIFADVVGDAASIGGNIIGAGVDAAKDTAEGLWDAGKDTAETIFTPLADILSIPANLLGLGDYGYDDKKVIKRSPQILGALAEGVGGLVDGLAGDRFGRPYGYGYGYRPYRGYGGFRYGRPYGGRYGYDWDDDEDKKVKRTIIPDILGLFDSDDSDYGYGYDDYDRKAKRDPQILGALADTVGDVANALLGGYGYDYGYDEDYKVKAKRDPQILGALADTVGDVASDLFGGYGYDYDDDYKVKAKRDPQIFGALADTVGDVASDLFGGYGYDYDDDYKVKAKRDPQILGALADTVGEVAHDLLGGADYGYGYDDYDYKNKRQIYTDIAADFDDDVDVEDLEKRQIFSGLLSNFFNGWGADEDDEDKSESAELPEVEEIDVDVLPAALPLPPAPATAQAYQPTL